MNQEKIDNGTIIFNGKGAELGVIKKVYSHNLARLELINSDSVALDLSLVSELEVSGRIIKRKVAKVNPNFDAFYMGASERLREITSSSIELIINHLEDKEIKKALQHFEFNFLEKFDFEKPLSFYETLGFIRGIELAGKNPQDFIVKNAFQIMEEKPLLGEKIAPEIFVDKLNQEKAFYRILWNLLRISVSQLITCKEPKLIVIIIDPFIEIGLKHLEIEYKMNSSNGDMLFWQERVTDCILKYIAVSMLPFDSEIQKSLLLEIKERLLEKTREQKVSNIIKEQAIAAFELFKLGDFEKNKQIELLHAGIKGFNLKIMAEKKAMKELKQIITNNLREIKSNNIILLQKEINEYTKEIRDVSKEFQEILFDIGQYLKKIDYGDSKVNEFYTSLIAKIQRRNYFILEDILTRLNKEFKQE